MTHEIVQYHNDFNTVPLRGFNERERRIVMALLHQVKNKDIEVVQLDFETLQSLSGWSETKHNASTQEFVTYLTGLSKKIGNLQGVLRSLMACNLLYSIYFRLSSSMEKKLIL